MRKLLLIAAVCAATNAFADTGGVLLQIGLGRAQMTQSYDGFGSEKLSGTAFEVSVLSQQADSNWRFGLSGGFSADANDDRGNKNSVGYALGTGAYLFDVGRYIKPFAELGLGFGGASYDGKFTDTGRRYSERGRGTALALSAALGVEAQFDRWQVGAKYRAITPVSIDETEVCRLWGYAPCDTTHSSIDYANISFLIFYAGVKF
ncbi:hypothetical protein AGMMS50229_16540 [Campylobacterota bacterium]|nr:hypothetical protein AGMMS50229_16540 [Campylobacterota bacterium]